MTKRVLYLLVSLAFVAACDKPIQPVPDDKQETKTTLSIFPASHTFTADSESLLTSLSSSGEWTAETDKNWISVSPASGTGNASVTVKVDKNTDEAREGTVTFRDKAKTVTATMTVKQVGYEKPVETAIVPNPDPLGATKLSSTTYQLLIYSFSDSNGDGIGDFKGIQNRLDYLDGLGATALWLSPAHPTSSYHAYDVDDYSTVNPKYGSETDFKNLINAAHDRGIKIYMDYVLNHSGSNNNWFKQAMADPSSPYRSYYVFSDNPTADVAAGRIDNYGGSTNPGMGDWHAVTTGDPGYKGRLHFKLDWTGTTKKVTVTETTAAAETANPSAKMWLWLGNLVGLYETSANVFEITYDVDTDWGFLVRSSDTTWDNGTKWGGDGKAIVMGQPYTLNNTTAANITFGGGTSYYFASFATSMPDLDYGPYAKASESPAFKALAETADKWIRMGVDGFRLDAVIWIYQNQVKANQAFLKQWYDRLNATYTAEGHSDNIFMVGEAWMDHGTEKQYYQGLPSCFEFDYFSNNENCTLRQALNGNAGGYVNRVNQFLSDHKAARTDAITSFFLTNHDQPRAAEILNRNTAMLKQAAAFLLTTPGKPFIYQGEELGYYGNQGGGDEYVRTPILWDKAGKQCAKNGVNGKVDTGMLTSSISVEAQDADANSLLNVYKTWSRLRNTYAAFTDGTMTAGPGNGGAVASWYITGTDGSKFLVIHHTGTSDKTIDLSDDTSHPVALLGTGTLADKPGSTKKTLRLGPSSSVVFKL